MLLFRGVSVYLQLFWWSQSEWLRRAFYPNSFEKEKWHRRICFLCFSYWENWKSPRQLWSWKRFIEEEAKKSSSYTILVVPKKTQLNFWIVCHFCIGGNGVVYGIVYGTCFLSVRDMENHRNDRTTFQMVIANVFTSVCQAYGCNELLNKE